MERVAGAPGCSTPVAPFDVRSRDKTKRQRVEQLADAVPIGKALVERPSQLFQPQLLPQEVRPVP
eukprot:6481251-Amphidinium_carterae.1